MGVLSVLAVMLLAVAPSTATAEVSAPVYPFPSSNSTVVASTGFIDADEVGYFWSQARGDRVTEGFVGPPSVTRAGLRVYVVTNFLNNGAYVDWALEINGVVVGRFRVTEGFIGTITLTRSFPPIQGPDYEVTIRVTNEVPPGRGSHTLAYAGSFPHRVGLAP